jgi:hypothetical protein
MIWAGFSSYGGFLGAVIGSVVFFKWIRPRPYFVHADVIMFAFPFAWIFGRLGCFLAKDHIGSKTSFFLGQAMKMRQDGREFVEVRHNLGLYEALYTIGIAAAFYLADKKQRHPGFYLVLWCVLYAPVRFFLDFLRNTDLATADVRWAGLTPAQWGSGLMFLAGLMVLFSLKKQPAPPSEKPALKPPQQATDSPDQSSKPAPASESPPMQEQRAWFRVKPASAFQVRLESDPDSHKNANEAALIYTLPVLDISAGGLSVLFALDSNTPPPTTEFSKVELRLSSTCLIRCMGRLCTLRPLSIYGNEQVLGLEFIDLSPTQLASLVHFVLKQERPLLQSRANQEESAQVYALVPGEDTLLVLGVEKLEPGGAYVRASFLGWEPGEKLTGVCLELPGEPLILTSLRIVGQHLCESPVYQVVFEGLAPEDQHRLEFWLKRWGSHPIRRIHS